MKRSETGAAGLQYAAAHDAHYQAQDLRKALRLYREIMCAHPDTQEAAYARAQIESIVSAVVPRQELFDAIVALALAHVHEFTGQVEPERPGYPVADSIGRTA